MDEITVGEVEFLAGDIDSAGDGGTEVGGGRFIDDMYFIRIYVVMFDDIALTRLRYGDDGGGTATVDGHGEIEIPVVEAFVVLGIYFIDEVMYGEDCG